MPSEYLFPGVYVQEIATRMHPIEGVPTSTSPGVTVLEAPTDVHRIAGVHTPAWTDHNTHDPGVTLLDLLAFMGESLAYRSATVSGHAPTSPHGTPHEATHVHQESAVIRHKP